MKNHDDDKQIYIGWKRDCGGRNVWYTYANLTKEEGYGTFNSSLNRYTYKG